MRCFWYSYCYWENLYWTRGIEFIEDNHCFCQEINLRISCNLNGFALILYSGQLYCSPCLYLNLANYWCVKLFSKKYIILGKLKNSLLTCNVPTKYSVVIGWKGTFREEGTGIWTAVINYWVLYKVPYNCFFLWLPQLSGKRSCLLSWAL